MLVSMTNIAQELQAQLPDVLLNEPLSKHCTFKIGGPADFFYPVKHTDEVKPLIQFCHAYKIPFFIFGAGSNILFDDKGYRGLVIKIATKDMKISENQIIADAGVMISQLLDESIKAELTGLEPWIGLPGTVGAAVYGNAGCNGLETKDILTEALLLNPLTGEIKEVNNHYFHFSYRHSRLKESQEVVLNATFKVEPRTFPKEYQDKMIAEIRQERFKKQPFGVCTTGSFFKNPFPDQPAGLLIEQAGLKGKCIGDAQISEKHGNFFINKNKATAKDILALAALAKDEVYKNSGLLLTEEVQIIPEKPL